jgi:hypothetical protein
MLVLHRLAYSLMGIYATVYVTRNHVELLEGRALRASTAVERVLCENKAQTLNAYAHRFQNITW